MNDTNDTIIRGIKLVTGEELVTEVTTVQVDLIWVKNPLVLITQNTREGVTINFAPWTIIADEKIPIQTTAIVACYNVSKDVEDNYIQNTSGLQIVSAVKTSQILQG